MLQPHNPPPIVGISTAEAARRLAAEGLNLLPSSAQKSFVAIMRDVVAEPMFLMLLAAGGIYLALGNRAEALFLLCFVFVVIKHHACTVTQDAAGSGVIA